MAQDQITAPVGVVEPISAVPNKEAGPVRVEAPQDLREVVQPSPELLRPEIPSAVAEAGVMQGPDNLRFSQSALQGVGATHSVNPSISQFEGLTLLIPEEKARELAKKGDPKEGVTGEAIVEVKQMDRTSWLDNLKGLRKAA